MSEPTHRMVNGVRVELTPEEKAEMQAQWDAWPAKRDAKRAKAAEREAKRAALQAKLNLTDEEWKLLRLKLNE